MCALEKSNQTIILKKSMLYIIDLMFKFENTIWNFLGNGLTVV